MKININASSVPQPHRYANAVVEQMTRALSHASKRITSVDVTLSDENGPRGGVDKQCRVRISLPPFGHLTASATSENPWAAVAQAAERARRVVLHKLQRPKSLLKRSRKNRAKSLGSIARFESGS
ncbi:MULTISPECIES: HPF/RaiA family ribosome-associated protein [unclassified Schlesneria]|uniref:HPF/RaiA family ribosome-associated protein n=1 Tax=Schlesneria TaxID=656899 RepID=UPI00359FCC29